jgi:hypothetical protein
VFLSFGGRESQEVKLPFFIPFQVFKTLSVQLSAGEDFSPQGGKRCQIYYIGTITKAVRIGNYN